MTACIQLQNIRLQNFRCHQDEQWAFSSGINILVGHNGSGKTSILEAAYLMAHGRSFRPCQHQPWLRWGSEQFHIQGSWYRYGPMDLQVSGKKKLRMTLQGRPLSVKKELKAAFPVLISAPQGQRLLDGEHNERRKWLDQLVMQCEVQSRTHYQAYMRAWMQRSRTLRQYASHEELEVWEQQMVVHGRKVQDYRHRICLALNKHLKQHQDWTEKAVQCHMHSHIPKDDGLWLAALQQHREKDKKTGRCYYGAQTDRLQLNYGEQDVRLTGSRGQQKLSAAALKLSESELRYTYHHVWPLLLLDDCFEALDSQRMQQLLQGLSSYQGQILMTSPHSLPLKLNDTIQVVSLGES